MKFLVFRSPGLRPLLLSLVVVPTFASKILHLVQHIRSVPHLPFLLYLPSFFLIDLVVSIFSWALLSKWGIPGFVTVAIISAFDLGAASSQFGFFYVTGAEVRWDAASNLATDTGGLKLLLSGLIPVFAAGTLLFTTSWALAPLIWTIFDAWLSAVTDAFSVLSTNARGRYLPLTNEPKQVNRRRYTALFVTIALLFIVICIRLYRPDVPYNHMSGTIPFTLFAAFQHSKSSCPSFELQPFPLSKLVESQFWEPRNGRYKGWRPDSKMVQNDTLPTNTPLWAPETWPAGFGRWSDKKTDDKSLDTNSTMNDGTCPDVSHLRNAYNPVLDPMRITNLDFDLLSPVQKALKDHQVPIKHIFLIEMESARKDVFPLKAGSHLHQAIIDSHKSLDQKDIDDLNSKLAALTPVAQQITGESGNFHLGAPNNLTSGSWNDTSGPGMGGINVLGTVTGSSLSFKSALGSHCGVGPLPVDFMFEADAEIYQPCIMHILKLFNQLKEENNDTSKDMHSQKWKSVFMQSITGEFDNQNELNKQMGFDEYVVREDINRRKSKHYHKGMKEINYFGFPEVEILPYLIDAIEEAKSKDERLFLSHFTSTTHHPWGLPSDFEPEKYWAHNHLVSEHEDNNQYLNAVRYVDTWLGTVMKTLEDTGIANETLVVFVGDHGQAFSEDSHIVGTFENGHISNFRVPLVFRHPLLPRIDVTANASSISILPTILDLLINTNSLNKRDKDAASDLIHEYEGQSLLRPYKTSQNGRQAWNIGIINTGGTMLSVASAAVPYRLILPLTKDFTYIFSDLSQDPYETDVIEDWDLYSLLRTIKKRYGHEAARWTKDAEKVGRWWVDEKKRLWNYHEK